MDTSIIVVIAIVVVFAVAVPAMIRKSATDLSRVEIDTVPDNAAVVSAETAIPGHDHSERIQVFHDKPRKVPSVPTPDISPRGEAPKLSLSATLPEFAVIDGHAEAHTVTEAAEHTQLNVLPIAVGESSSSLSSDYAIAGRAVGGSRVGAGTDTGFGAGTAADNVRMLHPAVHAVFNGSSRSAGHSDRQDRPPQATPPQGNPPWATDAGRNVSANRTGSTGAGPDRRGGGPQEGQSRSGRGDHLGEGATSTNGHDPQFSNPTIGTDEEHAMTEQATTLRESLKSLNTMVRGFSLVFLASVLGILVSSVLAAFSVVHIALAGVFLGLAVVTLFLVRTLNLRKREAKKKLRRLQETARTQSAAKPERAAEPVHATKSERAPRPERAAKPERAAQPEPAAQSTTAAQPTAAARPKTSTQPATESRTTARPGAKSQTVPVKEQRRTAPVSTSSGTAARIAAAAQGTSAAAKAAQARAAMNRSVEAKKSREEADTGEIPLVRIRKEAAEGHTTRQVLLTGPIPVVKENAAADSDATSAEATADSDGASTSGAAETGASKQPVEKTTAKESPAERKNDADATSTQSVEKAPAESADAPVSLGADLAGETDTVAGTADREDADVDVHAELNAAAPKVDDPFMQRLKSRDGWSPTPLPVPSYVDAPEAEHPVPSAAAADASSYETEARSREDIAAQFAEELGYRPELSDSAREEGPLGHGRKAIRTPKAADLGAVNDVLARRRA